MQQIDKLDREFAIELNKNIKELENLFNRYCLMEQNQGKMGL